MTKLHKDKSGVNDKLHEEDSGVNDKRGGRLRLQKEDAILPKEEEQKLDDDNLQKKKENDTMTNCKRRRLSTKMK